MIRKNKHYDLGTFGKEGVITEEVIEQCLKECLTDS